eukprot:TRINITY_DN2175_c0_g2_i5.p1 TRINITY_DN2175_c0_g2~~TRINITY_DN2175_c0_g2_i5.p1  ORF type:complete len:224 (+),score=22.08 TRINITY_DN2175_c0_g2_i5:200-871(+)
MTCAIFSRLSLLAAGRDCNKPSVWLLGSYPYTLSGQEARKLTEEMCYYCPTNTAELAFCMIPSGWLLLQPFSHGFQGANAFKDVVAPYKAMVRPFEGEAGAAGSRAERPVLLFFMGGIQRKGGNGTIRKGLFTVLDNASGVAFEFGKPDKSSIQMAEAGMRRSKFCLVPAGGRDVVYSHPVRAFYAAHMIWEPIQRKHLTRGHDLVAYRERRRKRQGFPSLRR